MKLRVDVQGEQPVCDDVRIDPVCSNDATHQQRGREQQHHRNCNLDTDEHFSQPAHANSLSSRQRGEQRTVSCPERGHQSGAQCRDRHILEKGCDGNAAPVIARTLANGSDVPELPARFALGLHRRHAASDQGTPAQIEMQAHLLRELIVQAVAAEKREQAAHRVQHDVPSFVLGCRRPSTGSGQALRQAQGRHLQAADIP